MKNRLYSSRVPELPTLRASINDVIVSIIPYIINIIWQEIEYEPDIMSANNGSHVEVH
jgi:hypothetical protein